MKIVRLARVFKTEKRILYLMVSRYHQEKISRICIQFSICEMIKQRPAFPLRERILVLK